MSAETGSRKSSCTGVSDCILEVRNLSCGFKGNESVLRGLTFTAKGGEYISILGKNGAGKSTLFKCILGLLRSYSGTIQLNGTDMRKMQAKELAKNVAYIPQSHYPAFNYSVSDMVLMGAESHLKGIGTPGKKEEAEALKALQKLGIEELAYRGFRQISGGEQQLVLMARAILQNARIWILDEPLTGLDYGNQLMVLKRLKKMSGEGYLILQSIHNPDQAYRYSGRILALKDGGLVCDGEPEQVMNAELISDLYGGDVFWQPPEKKKKEAINESF